MGARSRQEGAALVEFALVFPIVAMFLIGLVSSGLVFDAKLQLTHATREGARYGAAMPQGQTFASGTWATNLQQLVVQREGGNLAVSQVCVALVTGNPAVAVTAAHTTAGGTQPCFDDSAAGNADRRVQVSTTRNMQFDALVFHRSVTLNAPATARHEING
jgi:Flp pilus assembly protein TadG